MKSTISSCGVTLNKQFAVWTLVLAYIKEKTVTIYYAQQITVLPGLIAGPYLYTEITKK